MSKTFIANEELAYVFEDDNKSSSKEYQELLNLYNSNVVKNPKIGETVNAKFSGIIGDSFIFSVVGYKDDIRVENKPSEAKYLKNLQKGDELDVLITNINHDEFLIKGSFVVLYENMAHQTLKAIDNGASVSVLVKSINPAGYDVDILHDNVTLPGFMPNTLAGINKLYDPESIVGKKFEVMIESFSDKEGTYIVSRRKYLQSLIPSKVKELNCDDVYTGNVTGTTPFGVFVEFGECLTGMIHKANVNTDWQERLLEIKPGFEIDFYVKEIIRDKGDSYKIILTQILRETLWDTIKEGQVLSGTVKDVKQFGVLVNLDDETVGLIHASKMEKVKNVKPNQEINVKVISIDRMSRKIFLVAV
jgi:small subunit ribosomal protein S1